MPLAFICCCSFFHYLVVLYRCCRSRWNKDEYIADKTAVRPAHRRPVLQLVRCSQGGRSSPVVGTFVCCLWYYSTIRGGSNRAPLSSTWNSLGAAACDYIYLLTHAGKFRSSISLGCRSSSSSSSATLHCCLALIRRLLIHGWRVGVAVASFVAWTR